MLFQDSIRIKFHIWRVTKIDYGVNTGRTPHADVAQLIRATDFHFVGRKFESHHLLQDIAQIRG